MELKQREQLLAEQKLELDTKHKANDQRQAKRDKKLEEKRRREAAAMARYVVPIYFGDEGGVLVFVFVSFVIYFSFSFLLSHAHACIIIRTGRMGNATMNPMAINAVAFPQGTYVFICRLASGDIGIGIHDLRSLFPLLLLSHAHTCIIIPTIYNTYTALCRRSRCRNVQSGSLQSDGL